MNTNVSLESLTIVQITDLYNVLAEKPVKKFSTKPIAVDRLQKLLDESKHQVFETDGEYDVRPVAEEETPEAPAAEAIVLTDLEYGMMDLIAHAEHNTPNGATPEKAADVHTWLWADELAKNLGISEQAAGGVLSSLAQKGAIQMDVSGKKEDRTVWFTDLGFALFRRDFDAGRKYEKPTKAKGAKAKKEKGGKRGPAPDFADDLKIKVLKANPKREGTEAHARYALYKDGMTVGAYLKVGGQRSDLAWDSKREFIKIG